MRSPMHLLHGMDRRRRGRQMGDVYILKGESFMKKFLSIAILAGSLAGFSGMPLAADMGMAGGSEEIKGTLGKVDGDFYVIKDSAGQEHRAHFDKTTKTKGNVKEGSTVELNVKNGHVTKIEEAK